MEQNLPFKQKLASRFTRKLGHLIRKYPFVSMSIADKSLGVEACDLLEKIGFTCNNGEKQSHDSLVESIIVWLLKSHLILLHYRGGQKSTNIVNLFSALKYRAPYSSNETIIPIFIGTPSSKKQSEMFRMMGHFGIRYVIFIPPGLSPEKGVETLLNGLAEYSILLKNDFVREEKPERLIDSEDTEKIKQYKLFLRRGEELMKEANYEDAIKEFTKAINLSPDFDSLMFRGDAYYKVREFLPALNDYREAHTLELATSTPYAKMSACCFVLTKHEVKKSGTKKAQKWFDMGMKSLEQAEKMAEDVIKKQEKSPYVNHADPYASLVSALTEGDFRGFGLQDAEKKITELATRVLYKTKSVDYLDPNLDIDTRIDKAIMLTRNGFYEEAESIFRGIIDKDRANAATAFNNFAVELRKNGRSGKAFEIYLELLKYEIPDRDIVIQNMVMAGRKYATGLRESYKQEEAIQVYKNILHYMQKSGGKEWVLCDLAVGFLEMQNQPEASSRFMEAIYINPNLTEQPDFKSYGDLLSLKEEMVKKLTRGAL